MAEKGKKERLLTPEEAELAYRQFHENLEKYGPAVQTAVEAIMNNFLKGCNWEILTTENKEIRDRFNEINSSKDVSLYKIQGESTKTSGYIITMDSRAIAEILGTECFNMYSEADLKKSMAKRDKQIADLANFMSKGKEGKIGIFNVNDSTTITVKGTTYPAFAVTFNALLGLCSQFGYGLVLDKLRTVEECAPLSSEIVKKLTVAPSKNALFVTIKKI